MLRARYLELFLRKNTIKILERYYFYLKKLKINADSFKLDVNRIYNKEF